MFIIGRDFHTQFQQSAMVDFLSCGTPVRAEGHP
jgi:hypothetical protein